MTKTTKYHKSDFKNKKKAYNYSHSYLEEERVSLKDIKRDKEHKHYRNYDNALRAKNVDALLSYEDD